MDAKKRIIHLMGTKITLYVRSTQGEALLEEAVRRLEDYQTRFSANDDRSQLMQLNHAAGRYPLRVDNDLFDLIKIGKMQSQAEGSFLNIAIGPLIKLWKIGFQGAGRPPEENIVQILPLMDPKKIYLDETAQTVFLEMPGMEIDLGSLAKGYFSDQIMHFFIAEGAESALVDLGGNVLVHGPSSESLSHWTVGIQNPFLPRGNMVASLSLTNMSIVTSGIYERVYTLKGQAYHHIFNSQTGYPIENDIASLTIVAPRSLDCEIMTTRYFGYRAAEAIVRLNQIKALGALVITRTGEMAFTDNLKGKIHLLH